MRYLDFDEDARMAFHAEAAGDGEATLHHAYRAARQAAELASHREAAAQYQRALRFRPAPSRRSWLDSTTDSRTSCC